MRKRTDYPLNLLRDIPVEQILSDDQMKGLEYVLGQLTEREQTVLEYRYIKGMSYSEIGAAFELTGSRIQQIINRALRKLRHPARTAYIREGFAAHEASILEHVRMVMEKKEWRLLAAGDKILDQDIEILQLSIRPYNCLKRHGIDTLHELLRMMLKEDWHKECRNLGRKGAKEIAVNLLKLEIVDMEYPGCRPFVAVQHEAEKLCLTEQEWAWVLEYLKKTS
ncbi:MAG: sigma-70 family RNA polymerase sigma factor [Lachnospiraceae bacterium]|nr:sigma-70 family RNA polymerase sigma factor [Lachnospiraceae bacterium]